VPTARNEFADAQAIIEANGTDIVMVKDLFAKMVDEMSLEPENDFNSLREKLFAKAESFHEKYKGQGISAIKKVKRWIDPILKEDVDKYGERAAIYMNEVLSLKNELPLANVLYARDQSNLMDNTFVWSSMRHQIRQPEVHLFRTVLNYHGVLNANGIEQVQVSGTEAVGKFEGGDGIVSNGIVYIGVGGRTDKEGVLQIAESILTKGGRLMIPVDEERSSHEKNEMDTMHLDTMWMPIGVNEVVACMKEVKRRRILEVVGEPGSYKIVDRGSFADHLKERGYDVVPLTKREQEKFAPNFLNLGNRTVVLSLADGNNLTAELGKRGITVLNADLKQITKGFGGLHCMTAAIKRG
jgi:arginine deiminase